MIVPQYNKLFFHATKPVILIERNILAIKRMNSGLKKFELEAGKVRIFQDVLSALNEIKSIVHAGMEIDLIISDIFYNDEINLFRLITDIEKIPKLWNTPLIVYTNETSDEMYNQVRKDIVHLPIRMLPKNASGEQIFEAVLKLVTFKIQNRHFLELESKIGSFINTGNINLLKPAIDLISSCGEKYPEVCRPAKTDYLRGDIYYQFFKINKKKLEDEAHKLENFSPADNEFLTIHQNLEEIKKIGDNLLESAKEHFNSSINSDPTYWKALHALYRLFFEENQLKEAKGYLRKLLDIFPNSTSYFFEMGKLNELENDLSGAMTHYMESAHKALSEGVGNIDEADIIDIVDSSLKAAKNMLAKLNAVKIEKNSIDASSERAMTMNTLQKNNALVRSALFKLSKYSPENSEYLNKIGITYRRIGDYKSATKSYSMAIDIDKKNPRIRINYAAALGMCGSWKAALAEIKEARGMNEEESDEVYISRLEEIIMEKDPKKLEKILV